MNVALVFLLCGLCFAKPTTGKLRFPSIHLLRFIYLFFFSTSDFYFTFELFKHNFIINMRIKN